MKKLSFHPLTWWIFSGAVALAIARVNSPVFAIAAVGVMSVIVFTQRDDAPWGRSFNATLKLSVWIIAIRAIIARDLPVVLGIVIVAALVFAVLNLVVDLSYRFLDPRLRTSRVGVRA